MVHWLRVLSSLLDFEKARVRSLLFWSWVYKHLDYQEDRKVCQRQLADIRRRRYAT